MKELLRGKTLLATAVLSTAALAGCSMEVDSYLNNPAGVECDGNRTKVDLVGDGTVTFIVHGKEQEDVAAIQIRRKDNSVSERVNNDLMQPEQPATEGYSESTPVVNGPELYALAAKVGWVINVNKDSVIIQGSCDSL
jgi:hypothetical protein